MSSAARLERESAVAASLVAISGWSGAAIVLMALAYAVVRPPGAWAVVSLTALLVGSSHLALGIATRRRPLPPRWAHPTGALMVFSLSLATAITVLSGQTAGFSANVAILATFAGLLFLSWPWLLASHALLLAVAASLYAFDADRLSDASGGLLAVSGVAGGIVVHSARLWLFERMTKALADARAARALEAAARERFEAIFERSPLGILLVDAQTGRISDANPMIVATLGYSREELVGMRPQDLMAADEVESHKAVWKRLLSGDLGASNSERRVVAKDGTEIVLRARTTLLRDAAGAPAFLFAMLEDVTRRLAIDRQLHHQAMMLHSVGQAVIATDLDGAITYWNPAAEKLYGWRLEDVLGKNLADVTSSSPTREQTRDILENLRACGSWRGDFEVRRRDGTGFLAAVTDSPVLDTDGQLIGIVSISEDVTQARQTEHALRRAERDAALGTLVAGVAHEINNPLQFMGGNADLALMDIESLEALESLPPEARAAIASIRDELETLRRGVDQLAGIARNLRQVARRSDEPRQPADVTPIVESVLSLASPRLGPDIEVKTEFAPAPRPVVNVGELSQVVLNLILNASDAMGGKGRLVLRAREADGKALIEVQDDGPGIRPEDRERVFTPFFTTKNSGTGLGLSISRRVIEDHGGILTFESRPGRTVFRVLLPAPAVPTFPGIAGPDRLEPIRPADTTH